MNNPPFLGGVPLLGAQPTITIQAVLTDEERSRLREMLREVVREELAAVLHPEVKHVCQMCGNEEA